MPGGGLRWPPSRHRHRGPATPTCPPSRLQTLLRPAGCSRFCTRRGARFVLCLAAPVCGLPSSGTGIRLMRARVAGLCGGRPGAVGAVARLLVPDRACRCSPASPGAPCRHMPSVVPDLPFMSAARATRAPAHRPVNWPFRGAGFCGGFTPSRSQPRAVCSWPGRSPPRRSSNVACACRLAAAGWGGLPRSPAAY